MITSVQEQEEVLSKLPDSWRTAISSADEWPFVDPDEAMSTPDSDFNDFPTDDLPEIVPYSEAEPWGMLEEETDRDYQLFSHYRAQGLSRTQASTARHFGITPVYVNRVAGKRNWEERIRAWDDYREKVYTATVIENIKVMAEEHAGIANKGIKSLSVAFDALNNRLVDGDGNIKWQELELEELSVRSLFALAEKAARAIPNLMNAERLSRGLPTEISSQVVVNESKVTIQTTQELAELIYGLQNVLPAVTADDDDDYEDAEIVE